MHRNFFRALSVCAIVLLSAHPLQAAVHDIPSGDTAAFRTALTTAYNNLEDDTINLAAGTYPVTTSMLYGGGDFNEAFALTIAGAGAGATILEGDGSTTIMELVSPSGQTGDSVTVSGITFRNGMGGSGGVAGGLFVSMTSASISDCAFENNGGTQDGGGFYFLGETISITGSTFSGNTLTAVRLTGHDNRDGSGAGAYLNVTGSAAISSSTFDGNGNAGLGTRFGGGLYVVGGGSLTITDSVFSGNRADDYGSGAALYFNSGALTIMGTVFSDNNTDDVCDDIFTGMGGPGAAEILASDTVSISESLFSGNGNPCGSAGSTSNALNIQQGGGAETSIVNSIFQSNTSSAVSSSGTIGIRNSNGIDLTNNTFSGNAASSSGADILLIATASAPVNIYNNIFWGPAGADTINVATSSTTPVEIHNNDIDLSTVTVSSTAYVEDNVTNLNIDPLFIDQVGGDLHIAWNSPVKNQGDNAAPSIGTVDIDGDARILEGTVDMGADESTDTQPPPPPPPPPQDNPPPSPFTPTTGVVSIPEVQLSPAKAYSVDLTRLNEPGYVFELSNFKKVAPTSNPAATFSLKTGVLDILAVQIGSSTTTWHVTMLKRAGSFIFDLTSAKKNK